MYRIALFAMAVVALWGSPLSAQTNPSEGYWKFVESVPFDYPEEKVHKLYPVTIRREGTKLTAVARALDGNNPKIVHTEEEQVWHWTPPPDILVPGERFAMKFELRLSRPKFDATRTYIGGWINAGFGPPKPRDAAVFHVGADARTEDGEPGGLDVRDKRQGGLLFTPGDYKQESTVAVPGRNHRFISKEYPDQISFRVGGVIGNTREYNTIYEYRWVTGAVPADRGGAAGEKPKPPSGSTGQPASPGQSGAGKPETGKPETGKPGTRDTGTASRSWEYRVLDLTPAELFSEDFEKRLANWGEEGWELVSVLTPPLPPNTSPTSLRLIFKRPKS